MSAEENRKIIERYFEFVNAGDGEGFTSLLADDVTFWVPLALPHGGLYEGKAAVLRLFGDAMSLYDPSVGIHCTVEQLTAEDDRVAARIQNRGKTITGLTYDNPYHFFFRLRDGKIVEIREHLDTLYAYNVLFKPKDILSRDDVTWTLPTKLDKPRD